jgi:hypothetical protein
MAQQLFALDAKQPAPVKMGLYKLIEGDNIGLENYDEQRPVS